MSWTGSPLILFFWLFFDALFCRGFQILRISSGFLRSPASGPPSVLIDGFPVFFFCPGLKFMLVLLLFPFHSVFFLLFFFSALHFPPLTHQLLFAKVFRHQVGLRTIPSLSRPIQTTLLTEVLHIFFMIITRWSTKFWSQKVWVVKYVIVKLSLCINDILTCRSNLLALSNPTLKKAFRCYFLAFFVSLHDPKRMAKCLLAFDVFYGLDSLTPR